MHLPGYVNKIAELPLSIYDLILLLMAVASYTQIFYCSRLSCS